MIPHRSRRSPCCGIEHRASVACPVRTKPIDLKRPAIIKHTAHRSPNNGNTDDFLTVCASNQKLVSNNRLVMAMVLLNKGVCLLQGHRTNLKHSYHHPFSDSNSEAGLSDRRSSRAFRPQHSAGSGRRIHNRSCLPPSQNLAYDREP